MRLKCTKLLIATLTAASLFMPVRVLAEVIDDNPVGYTIDEIKAGDEMLVNNGTVTINNGSVYYNNGSVYYNNGTVTNNKSIVDTNKGTVSYNDVTINTNNGTVNFNSGTLITNNKDVGNNTGNIQYNFGKVNTNFNTVHNYGGTVNNNMGTVVEHYKLNVPEQMKDNIVISGNHNDGFDIIDGDLWFKDTDGFATLTPKDGYYFTEAPTIFDGSVAANIDGTYKITGITGDATLTVNSVPKTYQATLNPEGKEFGTQFIGYVPLAAETFTITSTGNQPLKNITVDLKGANTESFTLNITETSTNLDAKGGNNTITTFTVKPNDALSEGTYTASIKVTSTDMNAITKDISFKVMKKDASISPITATSDKYAAQDISITTAPGDYTLTSIKNGDKVLVKDTDYTIANDIVTLSKKYIRNLDKGQTTLTFDFGMTINPVFLLTVNETTPANVYNITNGNNSTWKGEVEGLTITCEGDLPNLLYASIDGVKLTNDQASMTKGSTIVNLKESYLKTLSTGQHKLYFAYDNGYGEATFNIAVKQVTPVPAKPATSTPIQAAPVQAAPVAQPVVYAVPKTGYDSNILMLMSMLGISSGLLLVIYFNKKLNRNTK